MKQIGILILLIASLNLTGCNNSEATNAKEANKDTKAVTKSEGDDNIAKPIHLTKEMFLTKVMNYEKNQKDWIFEGDKPCVIDFYADWCQPCKRVAPIMEELAKEYKGKVDIYKINTEEQRELAGVFGIKSIPSILFVPMTGKPQMTQGALPKEQFEKIIKEFLLSEEKNSTK
ncbi:MAG: thioredoxin [Bacteroidota bacterium]|nr:thioredoxin [Bacteroidota bacterium]